MCWVVFEVTVGSSNFPRRFHPKVSKGLSGFNEGGLEEPSQGGRCEGFVRAQLHQTACGSDASRSKVKSALWKSVMTVESWSAGKQSHSKQWYLGRLFQDHKTTSKNLS